MTVIASLDLATLTNNPQSIAEALEDVLETTSGNLGTLKQQAETDANTITNTLLPQAQTAHDNINSISNSFTKKKYQYQTLLNGFVPWNIQVNTGAEEGVIVQNLGALWIVNINVYSDHPTGHGQATIVNISNDFTLPQNEVIVGNGHFEDGSNNDYVAAARIKTDGNIDIYWYNATGNGVHIVGNFMGIDVSY